MNAQTTTTQDLNTAQPTERLNLLAICNRHRIAPPDDPQNLSIEAVIRVFEQKLREHQLHRSATANPWTGDHAEWKQTHDALQKQLQILRAAQLPSTNASLKNSESEISNLEFEIAAVPPKQKIASTWDNPASLSPSQSLPTGTDPGQQPGQAGTVPGRPTSVPLPVQSQNSHDSHSFQNSHSPDSQTPGADPTPSSHPAAPSSAASPTNATAAAPQEESQSETAEQKSEIPSVPRYLDPDLCEEAMELLAPASTKSPLDKLPEEQRRAIFELLLKHSSRSVSRLIAEPPPLGLSLKIGKSSLDRFKDRYAIELRKNEGWKVVEEIERTFKSGADTGIKLHNLTDAVLASRLFTCIADPQYDPRKINLLARTLNGLRRQHLLEKKIHIELLSKLTPAEPKSSPEPSSSSNNQPTK